MGAFPGGTPTADLLDSVVPDRPAFINNRDNHGAWVNSRALELAGITRGTPDPPDGRIERDAADSPSGTLHEGAMRLVARLIPPVSHAERVQGLLLAQAYLHGLGITAWQDAVVGNYETFPDSFDVYLEVAASGRLTARVVGAQWWERGRGLEQLDGLVERRERAGNGRFRATSVKLMVDRLPRRHLASGGLLQRRFDLPDAATLVLRGLLFVAVLAASTLYGRMRIFQERPT